MVKKEEVKVDATTRHKMLTLFTLCFPTVLLLAPSANLTVVMLKFLIAFYQLVMIIAFVDTHYDIK